MLIPVYQTLLWYEQLNYSNTTLRRNYDLPQPQYEVPLKAQSKGPLARPRDVVHDRGITGGAKKSATVTMLGEKETEPRPGGMAGDTEETKGEDRGIPELQRRKTAVDRRPSPRQATRSSVATRSRH